MFAVRTGVERFCYGKECDTCPMYNRCPNDFCSEWAVDHPHEAARLMGYEVVEDEQFREVTKMMKEANMDKPLKDWTLGDCRDYCGKQIFKAAEKGGCCETYCDLYKRGICKNEWCSEWDLSDKPRWTEQEVKDAKTVRRVFGRNGTVERHRKVMTEPYSNLVFDHLYINEELFPSIKPGQSYTLDEIIGGAE